MSDSYIPFYKALPLSRIVCIAHLYASFVSSLISRGVNSRLFCHPLFLFLTFSDSLKCSIRFVNCSIRFSTSSSSHVFKDSPLTSEADLLSRWKQTRSPTSTTCATTNSTVAKPPHVPKSPALPFFYIPPYFIGLSHIALKITSVVASTSHTISSPAPSNATFERHNHSPFRISRAFFIHPCIMSSSGLLSSVPTPFPRLHSRHTLERLRLHLSHAAPHLFNLRSPLLHLFRHIRQISFFLSTHSVTLSAAPIKMLSRYPT